jgi:hypothetical protein
MVSSPDRSAKGQGAPTGVIQTEANTFVTTPVDRHVAPTLGPQRISGGEPHAHLVVRQGLLKNGPFAREVAATQTDKVTVEGGVDLFRKPAARAVEALNEVSAGGLPRSCLIRKAL